MSAWAAGRLQSAEVGVISIIMRKSHGQGSYQISIPTTFKNLLSTCYLAKKRPRVLLSIMSLGVLASSELNIKILI